MEESQSPSTPKHPPKLNTASIDPTFISLERNQIIDAVWELTDQCPTLEPSTLLKFADAIIHACREESMGRELPKINTES